MKKRVVITGMGVVSSIGNTLETFWDNASKGQCGIKKITSYPVDAYPTQIAGEITNFDLSALPELNKPKRYPKAALYAFSCAHQALTQAGLSEKERYLAGTYIGTSLGGGPELESAYQTFYEAGWRKIPALTVIRGMPNSIANHLAIEFGLGGPNSTLSNACVSSAEAIGRAYEEIGTGKLTLALCGGTESLIWETIMAAWCKLRVMSTQNENPSTACKPFDQTRDGLVMADGAGLLVLESLEHAKARGANILGEIIGYGASCDAYHVTAPHTDGQARAIRAALDDARLSPNDIHYINAHGTGTTLNDLTETQTIKQVFGERAYDIPITAQKAMTGHPIGAAGALEVIATVLSLNHDFLLPTINLHHPDPLCNLDYVANIGRTARVELALSNHFAFGGANAALILKRY